MSILKIIKIECFDLKIGGVSYLYSSSNNSRKVITARGYTVRFGEEIKEGGCHLLFYKGIPAKE